MTTTCVKMFLDGEWTCGSSSDTQPVLDPVTGDIAAQVCLATEQDLDRALAAAERGFREWRAVSPETRGNVLRSTAQLLRDRVDSIALAVTGEQGKVLAEARAEVYAAAAMLDFQAGEAVRVYGRVLPRPAGTRSLVLSEPIGPVVAFCAWNFPVLNVVRKLSPAIATGCSVILKPSEETPASAVAVMRCFEDAGLPGNVAQLVFGAPDLVSRHLLASPVTRKLSFTGSVPVGKHLLRLAADTMMKATMELGGHGPVLVFEDCDLEKTLDTLVAHKFRNAGQVCIAPTRFYIQENIYERFAEGFARRTRAIVVGDGRAAGTQMGPLANSRRTRSIEDMVQDAVRRGARLLAGGGQIPSSGFFFEPTVLSDVPRHSKAMYEEPFSPLALLRSFSRESDAIADANRLPFGLAAYCFTESARRQNLLIDSIEAGMIAFNNVRMTWPDAPFGGIQDSGFGSEDGPEGITAHMITKAIHIT